MAVQVQVAPTPTPTPTKTPVSAPPIIEARGVDKTYDTGKIAVHPANDNVLWVSVWWNGPGGGVYKSTNGGNGWANDRRAVSAARSRTSCSRGGTRTRSSPASSAARCPGVYRSTDGGTTWKLLSGIPGTGIQPRRRRPVLDPDRVRIGQGRRLRLVPVARREREPRDPSRAHGQQRWLAGRN